MTDDEETRILELTNPWAARLSPRNAAHYAQTKWDSLDPDKRPPDGTSWASGFTAAMEFMWPGVSGMCKESDRLASLASLATRAASLATPTLVVGRSFWDGHPSDPFTEDERIRREVAGLSPNAMSGPCVNGKVNAYITGATGVSGTIAVMCDACKGRGCEGTTDGDGG